MLLLMLAVLLLLTWATAYAMRRFEEEINQHYDTRIHSLKHRRRKMPDTLGRTDAPHMTHGIGGA
jgi:hypothetical protein